MGRHNELTQLRTDLARVTDFVDQMSGVLPGLAELARLAINIDRLGPRLELIDRIGPRLEILDQLGPRLEIFDSLATLIEPLKTLIARVRVLDQLGEILRQFTENNHAVSESVRVDVETISALAIQVELFNRQLLEQLQKVLECG